MAKGQMTITAPVTINGPAALPTLNAGGLSRVFEIDVSGTANNAVAISNLKLTSGAVSGENGGGILNDDEAVVLAGEDLVEGLAGEVGVDVARGGTGGDDGVGWHSGFGGRRIHANRQLRFFWEHRGKDPSVAFWSNRPK